MRLDEAGRDLEVGLRQSPVELDRHAAAPRRAELDVGVVVAGEVVRDPDVVHDPAGADQLLELGALVRPVQAGCDQHRDCVGLKPGRQQLAHQGRQKEPVRHRARDVADQDAGAFFAARELGERGCPDRACERLPDRGLGVGQHGHRPLADDAQIETRRQIDREAPSIVVQLHPLHGPHLALRQCLAGIARTPHLGCRRAYTSARNCQMPA